jgi:surface antigen
MATVDEVLDIERSFLGEGGQRFWNWYPAAPGTAWCDIFQSYCLSAVGIPTHFAWVSAHFDYYRAQGRTSYDIRSATPGALIAFEWNSTPGGYDHIAMVESVDANGVTAINGNVNGSRVQRLWHPFNGGGIAEVAFPEYDTPPAPTPTESSEADMFKLINKDGREEWFALTSGGQAVHAWSAKPGGKVGPWVEVMGGIAGSNLFAEKLSDGRLQVTVTAAGGLWQSHQTTPGGGWSAWSDINTGRS